MPTVELLFSLRLQPNLRKPGIFSASLKGCDEMLVSSGCKSRATQKLCACTLGASRNRIDPGRSIPRDEDNSGHQQASASGPALQ